MYFSLVHQTSSPCATLYYFFW